MLALLVTTIFGNLNTPFLTGSLFFGLFKLLGCRRLDSNLSVRLLPSL
jgi:hypothetical protein